MGNPYFTDYHDKICFNPAKNFQIANSGAWYDEKYVITLNMNSDTPYRELRFVGVAEYDKVAQYDSETNEDIAVVVKLETGSDVDFFVGFNRKTGQNSHNKLASDEVTIIEAGANGESYAQSWFTAGLAQGESYSFSKWAKTNEELVVKVVNIDTSEAPGYAGKTQIAENRQTNVLCIVLSVQLTKRITYSSSTFRCYNCSGRCYKESYARTYTRPWYE